MFTCVVWAAVILAGNLKTARADNVEVCNGEEFRIICSQNEIIVMTSAEYGRKEVGRCIPEADDFMGCTNDVLLLLDGWCSGRRECNLEVPNEHLERANVECLKILKMYLRVEYTCLKVDTGCRSNVQNPLSGPRGQISSYTTDTKGCGGSASPWILSASPGQTISLTLTDFASNSQSSNLVSCPVVYGFIRERALGINQNICGGHDRQGALYTSKTNTVDVQIMSRNDRKKANFLLEYSVTGCPELSRPAHAWYKREGNEAVIGCETNDREWRLTCTGNTWIGEVGNCTQEVVQVLPEKPKTLLVQSNSAITMTGVVSGALILTVVSIVIGVVYIKKYRIRQETKHLNKTYSTMERNVQAYYRPVTLDQSANSGAGWENTLPPDPRHQMAPYPDQCACATLKMRNGEEGKASDGALLERQSLYNSIKSQ